MEKEPIVFRLNGTNVEALVDSSERLVDVLRDYFGLTGTKKSCGGGECGSCTVLLDGRPVSSCLIMLGQVAGRSVTTIEGIDSSPVFSALQKNFVQQGAFQCGFCAPGMSLIATWLLDKNPQPSKTEIEATLAGNLCRCTGYQKVVEAVFLTGLELSQAALTEEES